MTTVTIECDCGYKHDYPTVMPEDGSMLRHASLVETLGMAFDQEHADCPLA